MPLTPHYGETPLPHEEFAALRDEVRGLLEQPIRRADVYDLEQGVQETVSVVLMAAAIDGSLSLTELINEYFLRDLHAQLYAPVWNWGGRWRQAEVNIGIAPEQIAIELRTTLENIWYRWEHTDDWGPRELGIVLHAETVRIHPFTDGNGRCTRLFADLVFTAAQNPSELQYDWNVDKPRYIELLRAFDQRRDPRDLTDFVDVQSIER